MQVLMKVFEHFWTRFMNMLCVLYEAFWDFISTFLSLHYRD